MIRDPILRDWKERWDEQQTAAETRLSSFAIAPAATRPPRWSDEISDVYVGLQKHESPVLFQIQSGAIGLARYLFRRGVPEAYTPLCRCGRGTETALHIIVRCN